MSLKNSNSKDSSYIDDSKQNVIVNTKDESQEVNDSDDSSKYANNMDQELKLQKVMTSRHLFMISIGSAIGMGLWLGIGSSLHKTGPVGVFIGYLVTGSVAWVLNMSIGEIATLYPVSSAFPRWTAQFIDPSLAVTVGWMHWWGNMIGVSNELVGIATVLKFWAPDVSPAVWISIAFVTLIFIHAFAIKLFAEVESLMSGLKFLWVIVAIIIMIVISAGGAPKGDAIGFQYWKSSPFNHHGFKGFLTVLPACVFALSGIEIIGLVAAECKSPRKSVPKAVKSIWIRIGLFYILGSFVVTIVLDPNNQQLLGGSGVNASPFVIAAQNSGLSKFSDAMNVIILISVFSSASATFYGCPRILLGLVHLKMAPKVLGKVDRKGRPWVGYIFTALLSGGLAYINLSNSGATVFGWFSNLCSLVALLLWSVIFIVNIRLRKAWKIQGHSLDELPWKHRFSPYTAWYGLFWSILIVVIEFYLAVWPWKDKSSARNFFANFVSIVLMFFIYLVSKIFFFKGPLLIPLEEIDLKNGQAIYDEEYLANEDEDLGVFIGGFYDLKQAVLKSHV
ncbi:General amino acid permease [Wickerhamomyces ciferrii]|uniref:General amino acid permease n=1 Tax=Wickerhamomyces ciferrii (strain ATCC 14091 / BCRC 22168 / CBS 111 / JCM 3599 / NBRC 0793 / NRRL Y-1031 F-60-10) TaxID=1206466 RepID=K0KTN8_WICCF|nr:General amino acid permease [Wickerhamomyces ciferrii]CCH46536.1 General amino acid permease [Wickerhamomyces ciferrii]